MANDKAPKIVVIVGPTASGKSTLGIFLAQKFGGEIISADSRQVYRGMNLGTGKVPKDSSRNFQFSISNFQSNSKFKIPNKEYYSSRIRHHLIDIADPKKVFTVSDFKKFGEKAIKEILNKNKIPFIVGGTGFYIDALVKEFALPEVPPNKKLRKRFDKLDAEHLFKMLRKFDPERAKTIDQHNKRRLIRALEILKATGKPVPPLQTRDKYDVLYLGISWPKEILEKRIKLRLETRLKQGMTKEIIKLRKQGVGWKRLDDFGLEYRWISRFLIKNAKSKMKNYNLKFKNSKEYENLLKEIIKYSKRQMTWFKRNKEIHWVKKRKETEELIRDFFRFPQGV